MGSLVQQMAETTDTDDAEQPNGLKKTEGREGR